ncbi:hypothetical protein CWI84_00745 [Idiomarina tyrosinivorans]|uniref:CcoH-like protein n=1 Tax=Idiomarina tyrosinivorans TaxID=1445662 RepID=A0A432ZTZ8_9GAMM|nr:FixH family protein [Idiomarina tyrosinivorans]RUO81321.1 hypothetical protein CWI84_00745 [Idiomarina tyrosinivorans]
MEKPWYKQFWPWFLIGVPFIVIVVCTTIIFISNYLGGFNMVVDDYYKRGKAINAVVHRVKKARELGITFGFTAHDGQFVVRYTGGQPKELTAIKVSFYHATIATKDFQRLVPVNADGIYRTDIPKDISGKWTITIEPFDESWKVSEQFMLPKTDETALEPKLYGV